MKLSCEVTDNSNYIILSLDFPNIHIWMTMQKMFSFLLVVFFFFFIGYQALKKSMLELQFIISKLK